MSFIKISLIISVTVFTLLANAQDTPKFKVTIVGWHRNGSLLPKVIDTVFLNQPGNKREKVYTNVSTSDSSFEISDVAIGEHDLVFSLPSFCVETVPMVVCSRCDNQFVFFTTPKKPGADCVFERVEVSPTYLGGNKALAKDFERTLSKKEKKKLQQAGAFTVHFYLTKQGVISDSSFVPANLAEPIKNIVLKGLSTVTNWRPAELNGKPVDAAYTLNKQNLLNE